MRPGYGNTVEIPVTFDIKATPVDFTINRFVLAIVLHIGIIAVDVLMLIGMKKKLLAVILGVALFVIGDLVIRKALLHEGYFLKMQRELERNNGIYNISDFWQIYEIDDVPPYIVRFLNGNKAIFVAFDKDGVVGKGAHSDYNHFEALSDAYKEMEQRGIQCVHLDYSDKIGRDTRMKGLFTQMEGCKNEALKRSIIAIYDYVQEGMNHQYSSYDVYCFLFKEERASVFESISLIIDKIKRANYIADKELNKAEIAKLVETLLGVQGMSIRKACESATAKSGGLSQIRVIWTETNNVRTDINKTTKQLKDEARIRNAEKSTKKKKVKGINVTENVDIFASEDIGSDDTGFVEGVGVHGVDEGVFDTFDNEQDSDIGVFGGIQSNEVNSEVVSNNEVKEDDEVNLF